MTKITFGSACVLVLFLSLVACKDEGKTQDLPLAEKKVLSSIEKKQVSSIMIQAMGVNELKTFGSASVTTGVYDILSEEDGPFTVFAPTNDAFGAISTEKMRTLLNPKQKEVFKSIILNHIIKGEFDLTSLKENIEKGGGAFELTTVTDSKITASLFEDRIVLKNSNGTATKVVKGDVKGGNGLLHQVDAVLVVD